DVVLRGGKLQLSLPELIETENRLQHQPPRRPRTPFERRQGAADTLRARVWHALGPGEPGAVARSEQSSLERSVHRQTKIARDTCQIDDESHIPSGMGASAHPQFPPAVVVGPSDGRDVVGGRVALKCTRHAERTPLGPTGRAHTDLAIR